jgi:hypothetical protein
MGTPSTCGIDPGQRNMAAAVFCAVDPSGKMTVFDEIAMQGATSRGGRRDQAALRRVEGVSHACSSSTRPRRTTCIRPGAATRWSTPTHGIFTVPGQNSVTAGINNVRQRLQHGALEISAGCTVLIDEFRKYRWKTARKVSEDDPQEAPVKKDDHLLDALRYVCMARPYAPPVPVPDSVLPLHERLVQDQLAWRKNKSVYAKIADGGPGRFL